MIILSATRTFKASHFEVPHNLSKNDILVFQELKHYSSSSIASSSSLSTSIKEVNVNLPACLGVNFLT